MNIILSAAQVQEKLVDQANNVIFIDVQTTGEPVKGAVSLSVKDDLSGIGTFVPEVNELAAKLGKLGINNQATLVIYDEGSNRAASKAWFVMHYLGHESVYILQGGRNAWGDAVEMPLDLKPTTYDVQLRETVLADMNKVKAEMGNDASVLIDSRANNRYRGEVEPKYAKAGHIPGAKNYHTKAVFTEDGTFKQKEALKQHFTHLHDKQEIIVSCGSGNSACMNLVALKEAGFDNVALYPGGFSEWIADENNEVVKGDA